MNAADYVLIKQWFGKGASTSRYAYDGNNLLIYSGIAQAGSAETALVWHITKYTYDGNNLLTKTESSATDKVQWSERTTLTYS